MSSFEDILKNFYFEEIEKAGNKYPKFRKREDLEQTIFSLAKSVVVKQANQCMSLKILI